MNEEQIDQVGEAISPGKDSSNDYEARENLWDQQWPGTGTAETVHSREAIDDIDEVSGFPESVGTGDILEPIRDGEPYMPPIDPPVLPGGPEGIHTAVGFGTSVEDEAEREGPYTQDADLEEAATLMLRQDSLTSHYDLRPAVEDGVVTIRGRVSDVQDAEHAQAIVGGITGVVDVVDEMTIDPNVT